MKKYFFPSLLCLCVFSLMNPVAAQNKKQVKDSSVTIIFQESKASSTSSNKKGSSENNIIKIAPLGFISGQFPLLYERRINDFFTIQAGGGVTNRNYMRAAWAGMANDWDESDYPWNNNDNNYDEADGLYNFDNRTPKMGHMYTIEPRIYFESEAPEGSFLGLAYTSARYNFQIPALTKKGTYEYEHNGAPVKEFEKVTDYLVHFGGQQLFDRISLEYSTAVGLRKIHGEKYVAYDNGTQLVDGLTPYKESKITFGIGLKVGYHF